MGAPVLTPGPELTAAWLRPLRPSARPWVRLVCFPHAGGAASFFRTWAVDLPADVELLAVQYPGRLDRIVEPGLRDMATMAAAVAAVLTPLLDHPVVLFGHSMGAAVAYEVARVLIAAGRPPVRLVVSGRPAPHLSRGGSVHLAEDDVLWDEVRRLGGTDPELWANPHVREMALPALRADYTLVENYRPGHPPPLSVPLSVLTGADDPEVTVAEALAWAEHAGAGFSAAVLPGGHFYLVDRQLDVVDAVLARVGDVVPRRSSEAGP